MEPALIALAANYPNVNHYFQSRKFVLISEQGLTDKDIKENFPNMTLHDIAATINAMLKKVH